MAQTWQGYLEGVGTYWALEIDLKSSPAYAQWKNMLKNNILTWGQKQWNTKMVWPDYESTGKIQKVHETKPVDGNNEQQYFEVGNEYLLSGDQVDAMYLAFAKVFRTMDRNRIDRQRTFSVIRDLLDPYFGPGKAFGPRKISPESIQELNKLAQYLDNKNGSPQEIDNANQVRNFLKMGVGDWIPAAFKRDSEIDTFVADIKEAAIKGDMKSATEDSLEKVVKIVKNLGAGANQFSKDAAGAPTYPGGTEAIARLSNVLSDDVPTTEQLRQFKKDLPKITMQLHTSKLQRDDFKASGGESIVSSLQVGREKIGVNTKDGYDYINPILPVDQNGLNSIIDFRKKLMNEQLGKLYNPIMSHNYQQAKTFYISKAMVDSGILPGDGFDKWLEKKDAVTNWLQSRATDAAASWKYLIEILEKVKAEEPRIFNKGLNGGLATDQLAQIIAVSSTRDNGMSKAKPLMELLPVWSYGLMNSNVKSIYNGTDNDLFGKDAKGPLRIFQTALNFSAKAGVYVGTKLFIGGKRLLINKLPAKAASFGNRIATEKMKTVIEAVGEQAAPSPKRDKEHDKRAVDLANKITKRKAEYAAWLNDPKQQAFTKKQNDRVKLEKQLSAYKGAIEEEKTNKNIIATSNTMIVALEKKIPSNMLNILKGVFMSNPSPVTDPDPLVEFAGLGLDVGMDMEDPKFQAYAQYVFYLRSGLKATKDLVRVDSIINGGNVLNNGVAKHEVWQGEYDTLDADIKGQYKNYEGKNSYEDVELQYTGRIAAWTAELNKMEDLDTNPGMHQYFDKRLDEVAELMSIYKYNTVFFASLRRGNFNVFKRSKAPMADYDYGKTPYKGRISGDIIKKFGNGR
jgi:hypothetical protein